MHGVTMKFTDCVSCKMVIQNVVMSPTGKQFHSTVLLMALVRLHRNATTACTGVAHRLVGYRGIIPF